MVMDCGRGGEGVVGSAIMIAQPARAASREDHSNLEPLLCNFGNLNTHLLPHQCAFSSESLSPAFL